MGFRSDVREFFGAILGLLVRPSGPWCFPVRQRRFSVLFLGFQKRQQQLQQQQQQQQLPIFCSVSRVSEAMFVLQGHGVSPSGSADFLFCL